MRTALASMVALLALGAAAAAAPEPARWDDYLDYAYVYVAAPPEALRQRLGEYAGEAGLPLERYLLERLGAPDADGAPFDEARTRRRAIGWLLHYLAHAEPESLERSVDAIGALRDSLGRHENRYWYHTILAQRALEKGRHHDFAAEMLGLWLGVVVPLETPYETLQTLALADAPHSGFAAALPFVYENVARTVLLRSQEMGLDRGLDPLGALVRLLHDGRVGAQPDVIPRSASARDYLERIVERLDGPESDAGSLTFTLALFEAAKLHDAARGLLATRDLSDPTLEAFRVASGAYRTALERADTVSGRAAVHARALRLLGELYVARQRLEVDPEIDLPFSIEQAIDVYAELQEARDGFAALGFAEDERDAWVEARHGLWAEIQESVLNVGHYYLARSLAEPHRADEHARNAARLFDRYLGFFFRYAVPESKEGVPESAYFAAHEAARGTGDAFLLYAQHPTPEEVDLAIGRYRGAIRLFPFDPSVWSSLTAALERRGRESRFLSLARPAAEAVTRSRAVSRWIEAGEPGAKRIGALRRAFGESLALVYLGFGDREGVAVHETEIEALREDRQRESERLAALRARRADPRSTPPAAPDPDGREPVHGGRLDAAELAALDREIAGAAALLERIEKQLEARSRALPLYKATLGDDGLAEALRAQRDHPVHVLLRRMYWEEDGMESHGRNPR